MMIKILPLLKQKHLGETSNEQTGVHRSQQKQRTLDCHRIDKSR
jgi:hypothetical protein